MQDHQRPSTCSSDEKLRAGQSADVTPKNDQQTNNPDLTSLCDFDGHALEIEEERIFT